MLETKAQGKDTIEAIAKITVEMAVPTNFEI